MAAVMFAVAVSDLEMFKLPEKELLPTLEDATVPLVMMLPPMDAVLVISRLLETEAFVAPKRATLVMLFEFAFKAPPSWKALIWRVPPEDWIVLVPPPVKERPLPEPRMLNAPVMLVAPLRFEVPVMARVPVPVMAAARRPLVMSREPEKELLPVFVPRNKPLVVTFPAAWIPRLVLSDPENELEPVLEETRVPLVMTLPETDAVPETSKFPESEAVVPKSVPDSVPPVRAKKSLFTLRVLPVQVK